jgi:hypothetical protein
MGDCFKERERVTLRLMVYRQSVSLGAESLETHGQNFFSQLNTWGNSPYITFSLTRGWVCHIQLLLALASAVILGSESRGTRDHILLSQIRDFPFCRLLRLAGLRWKYSTSPPHGNTESESEFEAESESESYVTTDDQSVSVSWNEAPIRGFTTRFLLLTVAGLLMWGVLSNERTGLSFAIAAGPRQRSHSRVRIPWNLRHPHHRKTPLLYCWPRACCGRCLATGLCVTICWIENIVTF